jgi:hypothetical protein
LEGVSELEEEEELVVRELLEEVTLTVVAPVFTLEVA